MQDTPIISANDVNVSELLDNIGIAKLKRGQKYPKDRKTKQRVLYLDIITAFDIETSSLQFGPNLSDWESFMYQWQWQFGELVTVIGRTWEEFLQLVQRLNQYLRERGDGIKLLTYVHNLAFEFQYLSGIWHFEQEDIFATDVRSPLFCTMDMIELRCSYRLSNYSLGEWAKQMQTDHAKLTGDLDYKVIRYPWTELTSTELAYCVNDVICVVECVQQMLTLNDDTLYSIPYTSTGYIRRMVRSALRMWCVDAVHSMQPDLQTYDRLRQAFRGGDTHANRWHVQQILSDVYSYDRSSSYPDVIAHCKFPMSKWREEKPDIATYQRLLDSGRAVLLKVRLFDLRLRDPLCGDPYIPYDKCNQPGFNRPIHPEMDNGRILSASMIEIAITDIDFEIIQTQYTWDEHHSCILWMESARYGYLPRPMIDIAIKLYQDKTALKGIPDKTLVYNHSKALLNSIYGMMVQRVITNPILYINDKWEIAKEFDRQKEYNDAIEKAFLNYAWGVWVTAHARYRLFEGIQLAEKHRSKWKTSFVYADTDSVKATAELDFTKFNRKRIRDAMNSGAWACDPKGTPHYMGVFESEGKYDYFRTLGAKRYCVVKGDKLEITVAGVPKKEGSEILQKDGGIERFDFDYVFKGTGKDGAVYDDDIDRWILAEGKKLHITRNVTIVEVDYSMTPTRNYTELLYQIQSFLDSQELTDYNKKW